MKRGQQGVSASSGHQHRAACERACAYMCVFSGLDCRQGVGSTSDAKKAQCLPMAGTEPLILKQAPVAGSTRWHTSAAGSGHATCTRDAPPHGVASIAIQVRSGGGRGGREASDATSRRPSVVAVLGFDLFLKKRLVHHLSMHQQRSRGERSKLHAVEEQMGKIRTRLNGSKRLQKSARVLA